MTRAQAIAHFYSFTVCKINVAGSVESEGEDEATVEVNVDP